MPPKKRATKAPKASAAPPSKPSSQKILSAEEYDAAFHRDRNNSDFSDEELDSDDAFDSEDERKYGDMFSKRKKGDDEEDSVSESGTDDDPFASDSEAEDGDNGDYFQSLLDNLDEEESNKPNAPGSNATKELAVNHAKLTESEFSAAAPSSDNLTLDSLLDPLASSSAYLDTKKAMNQISKHATTHAPASDVTTDRALRKIAAKTTDKDVSLWTQSVKANREAETLDFRPKNTVKTSTNSQVNKFSAESEFEKSIAAALDAAPSDDEMSFDSDAPFDDDLGHNSSLTLEEVQKRHGSLAKMRSLMFFEERKRHQVNKIKSKKFRKIHKKQEAREKEKEMAMIRESDPALAKELDEKEAMKRMEERMTLQHKNTSKWARSQLRRGKNMDADARKALTEQITAGDRLRKKQMGEDGSDADDDDSGTEMDHDALRKQAQAVLDGVEADEEKAERDKTGLFKMAFMQKGMETQRQKARTEAEELLRELQEEGESEGSGDEEFSSSEEESAKILAEPSDHVQGAVDIDFDDDEDDSEEVVANTSKKTEMAAPKASSSLKTKARSAEVNPWLNEAGGSKKKKSNGDDVFDIDSGIQAINGRVGEEAVVEQEEEGVGGIATLNQDKLVKMAFAAPEDTEKEFMKEKQAQIDRDDPSKQKEEDEIKGWGAWSGAGVKKPKKKKKLSAKLSVPSKKVEKRKRQDDDKPTVIINEKRVKKLTKFKLGAVPYPFTSAEQYERAMTGAVGTEWNTSAGFKDLTRPEIITRAGRMIAPASKRMKEKAKERKPRF